MTVTTPQKFTQNVVFGNYRLGHCSMTAIAHGDLSFSRLFRLQIARASLTVNQHDTSMTIDRPALLGRTLHLQKNSRKKRTDAKRENPQKNHLRRESPPHEAFPHKLHTS